MYGPLETGSRASTLYTRKPKRRPRDISEATVPAADKGDSRYMDPATHSVHLDGRFLQRGFWLYVWEVTTPQDQTLLYVGRTGDSSSPNAQSPFVRMGQHLGDVATSSMLRNHLDKRQLPMTRCTFRLIAHGPVLPEAQDKTMDAHKLHRDVVAAIEKRLADDLLATGYEVMNTVNCKQPLDSQLYAGVRAAFEVEFPRLKD